MKTTWACKASIPVLILFSSCAGPARDGRIHGDLEGLMYARSDESHQASSYDRSGGNDDRLFPIRPGEERTIADLEGPGVIVHIWTDINPMPNEPDVEEFALRKIVLRMYWDGQAEPSVEVPYGDFFLCANARRYEVQSAAFTVSPSDARARNCWLQMPFRKHARITVQNECRSPIGIYFIIDYLDFKKGSPGKER
jgi:hypothetical protein